MPGWTAQREIRASNPPERVHFCRAIDRKSAVAQRAEQMTVAIVVGAAGLVLMPLIYATQRLGAWSIAVEIGVLAALVSGYLVFARVQRRACRRRGNRTSENPPIDALSDARVVCAGGRDALAAYGPLEDLPFEPAIFWASLARPIRTTTFLTALAVALPLGSAVSYVLHAVIGLRDMRIYPIWVALAAMLFLYAWRWPTYFRVTPGRLEMLCYSAFRRAPASVRAHDLRSCRVIVDLPRKLIFIDPPVAAGATDAGTPPPDDRRAEYSFALVRDGERFAQRVLLGAISRYVAPRLPTDELIA